MKDKKIIAIIPARGGSKTIPKKNIVDFCDRPLIAWSIEDLKESKYINDIYISTDDKEIAAVSEKCGAKIIWRPEEISGDQASSEEALKHALNEIQKNNPEKIDYVVFLQATSPLREPEDIDRAVDKIISQEADSLFSGSEIGDFYIWREKNGRLESLNYDYKNRKRRQDFEKQFVENGSIYIFKPEVLFKHNNRLGEKIAISQMEFWKSFEIDDSKDLDFCKEIFKIKNMKKQNKTRVVWWNGKLIPEKEAKLSIYDSALMFGDMVFEMTRSFNKKQFKLREHLERLYTSIKFLEVPITMSLEEMEKHCYEVIEANDPLFAEDDEHRLMIDISRGLLSIYQNTVKGHVGPNIIISDFPLKWTVNGMGKLYDEGVDAVITSQRAIPAQLLEPKVKNRSRIHYLMANIQVSKYKGKNAWALLLDPDGFITEGTGDNFFIVKDGKLFTPEPRNILRGVSRKYIIQELCPELGLEIYEKNLELYDVLTADEAFFSATPFCIMPATKINGLEIGNGKMGKITKKLLDKWSSNVGVDIIGQIKKFNSEEKDELNGPSPYSFRNNK